MKALYAVVFVLSSFTANAQSLETWIEPYSYNAIDCLGEATQQGEMRSEMSEMELLCAAMVNEGHAITVPEEAEVIVVGAIQPGDQNSTVDSSTGSDDELALDDTTAESAASTQIVATKSTIAENQGNFDEADDVTTTGPNYSEEVPVGAIQASEEHPNAAQSRQGNAQPTADDMIE